MPGFSVRTLHYYDEIGLLCPQGRSESGYRYYDRESLRKFSKSCFSGNLVLHSHRLRRFYPGRITIRYRR